MTDSPVTIPVGLYRQVTRNNFALTDGANAARGGHDSVLFDRPSCRALVVHSERMGSREHLASEVAIWQEGGNNAKAAKANWQFKNGDARVELRY